MLVVPDENNFIQQYLETLSSRSVRYGSDYTTRPEPSPLRIKRQPPSKNAPSASADASDDSTRHTISVTVKILKPASQFNVGDLDPSDTVSDLKARIHAHNKTPVDRQRLLLKGKALADTKSLCDYNIGNGAVLHLMITKAPAAPASPGPDAASATATVQSDTLSAEAEQKLKDPAFWTAVERVVQEQLQNESDTRWVLEKWKKY
ncbi:ubiquitin-related domain-containing protein [Syncephalastrum racemosum]|uniref:Ubiquitin-related domain-containing protein n=1 Tax=Syncephalastrum racemosum TaxID=13706 RepID=A0A1X2HRK9_SYNRA|nr:ubiquitin-related domain-containing protein [Syncephalastrum racemosum]